MIQLTPRPLWTGKRSCYNMPSVNATCVKLCPNNTAHFVPSHCISGMFCAKSNAHTNPKPSFTANPFLRLQSCAWYQKTKYFSHHHHVIPPPHEVRHSTFSPTVPRYQQPFHSEKSWVHIAWKDFPRDLPRTWQSSIECQPIHHPRAASVSKRNKPHGYPSRLHDPFQTRWIYLSPWTCFLQILEFLRGFPANRKMTRLDRHQWTIALSFM